jgi:flagellar protein FlgJ
MKIGDPTAAAQLGLDNLSTNVPSQVSSTDSPEAILEAAKAFEAVFINQLMKNMRKTLPEDGLLGKGFANQVFNGMLDQEYSQMASKSGQLGLANMIAEQFGVSSSDPSTSKVDAQEDKMVMVDGEEVPAWMLEEIVDDPWSPGHDVGPEVVSPLPDESTRKAQNLLGSHVPHHLQKTNQPSSSSLIQPGLSAPSQSEFAQSNRIKEAYGHPSSPSIRKPQ